MAVVTLSTKMSLLEYFLYKKIIEKYLIPRVIMEKRYTLSNFNDRRC